MHFITKMIWIALVSLIAHTAIAAEKYQPFILADINVATIEEASAMVTDKLTAEGFEVVGSAMPYSDGSAKILGITNDTLKLMASEVNIKKKQIGGFGAVLHVAITNNNGAIEVTYTNPRYLGYAYHMGAPLAVETAMQTALGNIKTFGAKGLTEKNLKNYQYAFGMPKFKDAIKAGEFDSHADAVSKIAEALNNPEADLSLAWQVEVNAEQTVFGVNLLRGPWAEDKIAEIMKKVDTDTPRSTAALPWEILVSGSEVYFLPGKYRLAVMFPDLGMGTFMGVSEVPGDMEKSAKQLVKLAGGKVK